MLENITQLLIQLHDHFSRKCSLREETRNSLHKSDGETKVIFSLRKRSRLKLPFLCYGGHLWKANVCIFKTMIMQFEAGPKRCIKHWTIYKKSFRFGRLSLGYVVCFVSVYTISCCLQCRVLVILCL